MMMILVLFLHLYTMINIVIFVLLISCCQPAATVYTGNTNENTVKSNNIYDKIFHASSHLPSSSSSSSKDLKWGYKLNPKLFTGLHNTVISINRIKTPFWPLFHHQSFGNPGLVHAIDNGGSGFNNVHLNDDIDQVNKTVVEDVANSVVRLDDFPPYGVNNYQIKVPVTVAQNSKNFVFRIGNWLYVGKNKNDVFVQHQQGYF